MSALLLSTLAAGSSGQGALYVDDVFSAYLRTGTGTDTTVTTGIDMTKGYMLWSKGRSGATEHAVYDSARGATLDLVTNSTAAQTTQATGLKAVSSTGHTIGSLEKMNTSGATYVDWVFRKAPKFFDVVTYTGNGVAGRQIAHSLGIAPGMIMVKSTSTTSNWQVYHKTKGANHTFNINLNAAPAADSTIWNNSTPTDAVFTVGSSSQVNANAVSYVAYIFADDATSDGIVRVGSFVYPSTVDLGWEPQFLFMVRGDSVFNYAYTNWLLDTMRGLNVVGGINNFLYAGNSSSEATYNGGTGVELTSTGFKTNSYYYHDGSPFFYLAIRRPNKPPTTGTQVYNAITRNGNGSAGSRSGVGFAPDLWISGARATSGASDHLFADRLRGVLKSLGSTSTAAEGSSQPTTFDQDGVTYTASSLANSTGVGYIDWFFRRAPGFFDVVCDTGTGVAHAIAHSLTKTPELIIRKSRSVSNQWEVWHSALAATEKLVLNSNAAKATDTAAWNSTLPTATQFTVGAGANVNAYLATFVTYLFATLPGISKVGSYTGNGTSQTIDCGFSTGARFFLVKATSTTGSWWVYDSARGIVSAADPALQLNSTAAEITSADAVDPVSVGIIVNQEATCSINATGVSYIFLAIA